MSKIQQDLQSLKEVYKEYFKIGAAINSETLKNEGENELLKKHFNSLTAENEMKFERIHPNPDHYTFDYADEMIDFAEENNMGVRGHTLLWHNQTPDWVFEDENGNPASKELLLSRLDEHIKTVMTRYKGKIYSWDVVNEAISDEKDTYLRPSKWLDIIGEDFIKEAFERAHKYDPEAALFYNDYNESDPVKSEKIFKLVKSLKDQGVPIHGVGLQAHWNIVEPKLEDIRNAFEKYASLGLQLQVTEFDVSVFKFNDKRTDLMEPTESMLEDQAQRYEAFFNLFKEYKDSITSVTFWGVSDQYTWLSDFPVKGRKNWPFLFDEKQQAKDSFWKIINK